MRKEKCNSQKTRTTKRYKSKVDSTKALHYLPMMGSEKKTNLLGQFTLNNVIETSRS